MVEPILRDDPRFFDRPAPTNDDFWALSDIIRGLDEGAERGEFTSDEAISAIIDFEALYYVAKVRSARGLDQAQQSKLPDGAKRTLVMATYIDGFLAGFHFAKRKDGE